MAEPLTINKHDIINYLKNANNPTTDIIINEYDKNEFYIGVSEPYSIKNEKCIKILKEYSGKFEIDPAGTIIIHNTSIINF